LLERVESDAPFFLKLFLALEGIKQCLSVDFMKEVQVRVGEQDVVESQIDFSEVALRVVQKHLVMPDCDYQLLQHHQLVVECRS